MATKKPKGLGMGLEALLGPKVSDTAPPDKAAVGAPSVLKLGQLQAGKYQPRTRMDEGSLYELAESIKAQGVMQPVLVRPVAPGRYEIIAGERRTRAAKLAGLDEVPVLVKDVPHTEHTRLPGHLRGKTGTVETVYDGAYTYFCSTGPDGLGAPMASYCVRFDPAELWDAGSEPGNTAFYADLFEAYLEAA